VGLDTRILKELTSPGSFQWDFRESYSTMAKRLGADAETVRVTLRRSIEAGLIREWRLILNPELLGHKLGAMQLDVDQESDKPKVLSQIRLVSGVVLILGFHGRGLRVVLYFEDEFDLERKVELIRSICRYEGKVPNWTSSLPKCSLRMKNVDWKILGRVMHEPRKDSSEVARELGVSSRTVNRRLRVMIEGKVAYLIPVRNVKKSRGTVCSFLLFCSEKGRAAVEDFAGSQPQKLDFVYNSAKGIMIATFIVNNISEANELHERLRSLAGVGEVKMGLMSDFIFVDDWLDQAVARRIVD
jgi:DNA-binding Lrp family transcriptional regulator